ncbi:MAG: hypothetical protein AAGC84_13405, partial [Pseudomonas sp.]
MDIQAKLVQPPSLFVSRLIRLAAILLCIPLARAAPEAPPNPPAVTPIDKELDLQNKFRLQQKIEHELEESKRQRLRYLRDKSDKKSTNKPRGTYKK